MADCSVLTLVATTARGHQHWSIGQALDERVLPTTLGAAIDTERDKRPTVGEHWPMNDGPLPLDHGLFGRLRRDAGTAWKSYVAHDFVLTLGRGTLPEAAFRHFLVQDYLFLIQFARAHALAGFKATALTDIRAAAASVSAIVDVEMPLHVGYCAGWGLDEPRMAATPEALETTAYTRFVLERGLAGDLLDLQVALAPCLVGYGESGEILLADPDTRLDGNPYREWITAYTSEPYRALVRDSIATLDRLGNERGAEARYPDLLTTFVAATKLEEAFWDMGWRAGLPTCRS